MTVVIYLAGIIGYRYHNTWNKALKMQNSQMRSHNINTIVT